MSLVIWVTGNEGVINNGTDMTAEWNKGYTANGGGKTGNYITYTPIVQGFFSDKLLSYSFSFSAWVNITPSSEEKSIFEFIGLNDTKHIIYKTSDNKIAVKNTAYNINYVSVTSPAITTTGWNHITMIHDAEYATIRLIINGNPDDTFTFSSNDFVPNGAIVFGEYGISDLRVYNIPIGLKEAMMNYHALIMHIKLSKGNTTSLINSAELDSFGLNDCSGFMNSVEYATGTASGITHVLDAPIGFSSTSFNENYYVREYLNFLSDKMSISVWVKCDWINTDTKSIGICGFADSNTGLRIINGILTASIAPIANSAVTASYNITTLASGWHLFTMTWSGTSLSLYVDDKLVNESAALSSAAKVSVDVDDAFYIGRFNQTNMIEGSLCDFRLYANCLSLNDVISLDRYHIGIDSKGTLYTIGVNAVNRVPGFGKNGIINGDIEEVSGDFRVYSDKIRCPRLIEI